MGEEVSIGRRFGQVVHVAYLVPDIDVAMGVHIHAAIRRRIHGHRERRRGGSRGLQGWARMGVRLHAPIGGPELTDSRR